MVDRFDVELCPDCVYFDANGWDEREAGRPLPDPVPMSRLEGYLVGPALEDGGYECAGHFSWSPCDGCGCTLGGDRFCYTAVARP